jgi:hypothetical protein
MFAECDLLAEGIDHVDAVYLLLHAGGLHLFVVSQSGRIPVIRNAYQRSGTSIPCNPHPIGTLTLFILWDRRNLNWTIPRISGSCTITIGMLCPGGPSVVLSPHEGSNPSNTVGCAWFYSEALREFLDLVVCVICTRTHNQMWPRRGHRCIPRSFLHTSTPSC